MKQTEDITDDQKTVVFRRSKEGHNIIALFPKVPAPHTPGFCYCFTNHWDETDYDAAIAATVPAIEREYGSLLRRIGALGHGLMVRSHEEMQTWPDPLEVPERKFPIFRAGKV